jgi:hypothetical protein
LCRNSPLMIDALLRLALLWLLVLMGCRDAGSNVFPETVLGRVGRDWLAAHNRHEGHAVVHFTMVNRGAAPMSGAQMDSTVYAGVRLADSLGPLVPVKVAQSSDTLLAVDLTSRDGKIWMAEFRPAVQPSLVKVDVRVSKPRDQYP